MAQVSARQAPAAQAPAVTEEPLPYQAMLVPKQTILTNIKVGVRHGGPWCRALGGYVPHIQSTLHLYLCKPHNAF